MLSIVKSLLNLTADLQDTEDEFLKTGIIWWM